MKVSLINYTCDAEQLLIFSKQTRLLNSVSDYNQLFEMSPEEKQKQLEYVFGTIGSSWEFVDYTFLLEGVTRAFTHQLVRHKVGVSFAQQSMRAVDMQGWDYLATGACKDMTSYHEGMAHIAKSYQECIESGAPPQDARGLLPTNVLTNILFKVNLRALSHIMNVRLCYKTQGEFQDVAEAMKAEVLRVHPWGEKVLKVHCAQHGNCCFSGYKDCPVKTKGALPEVDLDQVESVWKRHRHEVIPKLKRGGH